MIKPKLILLMYLVALIFLGCFSRGVQAFSCTSNGVNIGGSGTFTIPVDVVLEKKSQDIIIADISSYTTCIGYKSYSDALRTNSGITLSSVLTGIGYQGFIIAPNNEKYIMPASGVCVWPDAACSTNFADGTNIPLKVKIGMMQNIMSGGSTGTVLPAGAEIARLSVQQRSGSSWGWGKIWRLTLRNPLVIPAYTCSWNNPNQTITLPPVMKKNLTDNGAGRYPEPAPFKLNLTCEKNTTVSVQFDGTVMIGKTDVLANNSGVNQDVGIQLLYNSVPVKFAEKMKVINNSDTQETLSYQAHYFYNGGSNIQAGDVNATTTITFTYQ